MTDHAKLHLRSWFADSDVISIQTHEYRPWPERGRGPRMKYTDTTQSQSEFLARPTDHIRVGIHPRPAPTLRCSACERPSYRQIVLPTVDHDCEVSFETEGNIPGMRVVAIDFDFAHQWRLDDILRSVDRINRARRVWAPYTQCMTVDEYVSGPEFRHCRVPGLRQFMMRLQSLPPPTMITFSGGGYHVSWRLSEPVIFGDWRPCPLARFYDRREAHFSVLTPDRTGWTPWSKYKGQPGIASPEQDAAACVVRAVAACAGAGADRSAFDLSRRLRLAGSFHPAYYGGPRSVQVAYYDPTAVTPWSTFQAIAAHWEALCRPAPKPRQARIGSSTWTDELAATALAELNTREVCVDGSGCRARTAMSAVCRIVHGFNLSVDDLDSIVELVHDSDWNQSANVPWTAAEVRHKVESALSQDPISGAPWGYLLRTTLPNERPLPDPDRELSQATTQRIVDHLRTHASRDDVLKVARELVRGFNLSEDAALPFLVGWRQHRATTMPTDRQLSVALSEAALLPPPTGKSYGWLLSTADRRA